MLQPKSITVTDSEKSNICGYSERIASHDLAHTPEKLVSGPLERPVFIGLSRCYKNRTPSAAAGGRATNPCLRTPAEHFPKNGACSRQMIGIA